ncbi:hypothetical protein JQC92_08270 [Shewanella sp. 202IG2-18]|uniref:transcription termination/antitermination NusG family protein n=1 Tax=Parashewanella hymeniacidonis TaxID=2807618 RepID=UPI00195FABDA|nr:transcription termination/antitermination NusG family protein [Parashewanella hymeniacidonis]MBM7072023.1 hypothetical protein [Parashewanella hymeniacidonis]
MTEWYALKAKKGKMDVVMLNLSNQNVEYYQPCYPKTSIDEPLVPIFKDYLFFNLETHSETATMTSVKSTHGVNTVVSLGDRALRLSGQRFQEFKSCIESQTHRRSQNEAVKDVIVKDVIMGVSEEKKLFALLRYLQQ